MKVFISSVISGYEDYRDAAAQAVHMLGHQAIRAEDFPAAPNSPQRVCMEEVREADLVLLLMGGRYGYVAPSGLSATHEEYREARECKPVFALIEKGVDREAKQQEFISEVQSYSAGHYTARFTNADELKAAAIKALHQFELSVATGPVDEAEMLERAKKIAPVARQGFSAPATLFISIAGGPKQQVLRPTEIEDKSLARKITQELLFGQEPLFDTAHGTDPRLQGSTLVIKQDGSSVSIDQLGSVVITMPAYHRDRRDHMAGLTLVEEDVRRNTGRMLRFVGWLLDEVDHLHRLSNLVILAGLSGAAHMGWQTQAESATRGNSVAMGRGGEQVTVNLTPLGRNRASLLMDTGRIAEDLTALLRREVR